MYIKLAEVFGFKTFEIRDQKELSASLKSVLGTAGPVFCVVRMPGFLNFTPKLSSKRLPDGRLVSAPLEDMFPFLEREEFEKHMLPEETI